MSSSDFQKRCEAILLCLAVSFPVFLTGMLWVPGLLFDVSIQKPAGSDVKPESTDLLTRQDVISMLNDRPVDMVFLGNSITYASLDPELFEKTTGIPTLMIAQGGSASAFWYLVIKNAILQAENKPKFLAIIFRDAYLTYPEYRATGIYKQRHDLMKQGDDPLFEKLTTLIHANLAQRVLHRYFLLYRERDTVRQRVENIVRHGVQQVFRRMAGDVNPEAAIQTVFSEKNYIPALVSRMQQAAEAEPDSRYYDFARQLPRSFLPYMVSMCRENNIQLLFIRAKRRIALERPHDPKPLSDYMEELKKYLEANGVLFLDYSQVPWLTSDHYGAGDHLNLTGKALFTQHLAADILPLLLKRKASDVQPTEQEKTYFPILFHFDFEPSQGDLFEQMPWECTGTLRMVTQPQQVFSGSGALWVQTDASPWSGVRFAVKKERNGEKRVIPYVMCKPNQSYVCSMEIKVLSNDPVPLVLHIAGDDTYKLASRPFTATSEWSHVVLPFTTRPKTRYLGIELVKYKDFPSPVEILVDHMVIQAE